MLRGSPREKGGGNAVSSNVAASGAVQTPQSHGARGSPNSTAATTVIAADRRRSSEKQQSSVPAAERRSSEHQKPPVPQHDRLTELEKALVAAKEETAALRHELDRVKQDAQASAEVSRYQAQHHAPSEDAEMQTEASGLAENDALKDERKRQDDLINQNHALRYRLAELQDQLISQSSLHQPELLHSDADWNALTLRLHETEKESHTRLQQLLSLKSSISSLTRTDSQVSDSELAESFLQLANRVREWVVSNYRRSKMDVSDLPEASVRVLRSIKDDYTSIDGADKLPLYQAVVSRVLVRVFSEPLIVGMPDEGIYAGLRAFAESTQHEAAGLREWRRVTLQVIERSTQAATTRSWRNEWLESLAGELESIMSSISSTDITSSARAALIGILTAAADLQRTLYLQKAGYNIIFFDALDGKYHHFDDRAMEPINDPEEGMDEDSEPYTQREFAFCIFPCLEKIGNDVEHIVFKARVCCGVG